MMVLLGVPHRQVDEQRCERIECSAHDSAMFGPTSSVWAKRVLGCRLAGAAPRPGLACILRIPLRSSTRIRVDRVVAQAQRMADAGP
jgi:hypothetical protein